MAALAARCLGTISNHLRPAHGQQSSCLAVGCASQGDGSTSPADCAVPGHHMQSSAGGAPAAVVLPGRHAARAGPCRLGPVRSHASEFSGPGGMGQFFPPARGPGPRKHRLFVYGAQGSEERRWGMCTVGHDGRAFIHLISLFFSTIAWTRDFFTPSDFLRWGRFMIRVVYRLV